MRVVVDARAWDKIVAYMFEEELSKSCHLGRGLFDWQDAKTMEIVWKVVKQSRDLQVCSL